MLGLRGVRLGDRLSRDRGNAGARDLRRRRRGQPQDRRAGHRRDHDPAAFGKRGSSTSSRRSSSPWPRRSPRRPASTCPITVGTMIELPRAALQRRRDRRDGRVLLVRHQRPDPDDARHLARRRGLVPRHLRAEGPAAGRSVRHASTRTASANWSRSPSSAAAPRARTSSSASAASTAAIRPRSPSARRSGSTTSPARPSACRSPASRRRRRRSASPARGGRRKRRASAPCPCGRGAVAYTIGSRVELRRRHRSPALFRSFSPLAGEAA